MKPVSIAPESLSTIAGSHGTAGALIAGRAVAERFDAAALAPTFGVIGAPFLSSLSATMESRATRLDGLAGAHAGQAAGTVAASASYTAADAAGAAAVAS